jgi:hypothetical protein
VRPVYHLGNWTVAKPSTIIATNISHLLRAILSVCQFNRIYRGVYENNACRNRDRNHKRREVTVKFYQASAVKPISKPLVKESYIKISLLNAAQRCALTNSL